MVADDCSVQCLETWKYCSLAMVVSRVKAVEDLQSVGLQTALVDTFSELAGSGRAVIGDMPLQFCERCEQKVS